MFIEQLKLRFLTNQNLCFRYNSLPCVKLSILIPCQQNIRTYYQRYVLADPRSLGKSLRSVNNCIFVVEDLSSKCSDVWIGPLHMTTLGTQLKKYLRSGNIKLNQALPASVRKFNWQECLEPVAFQIIYKSFAKRIQFICKRFFDWLQLLESFTRW
jgi:hypothetical protein